MGIPVERSKNAIIVLVAMAAGASVAFTGIIAFAGLIVPHLVRMAIGPDYRTLLPASALLGAVVLVGSDIAARTIVAPGGAADRDHYGAGGISIFPVAAASGTNGCLRQFM